MSICTDRNLDKKESYFVHGCHSFYRGIPSYSIQDATLMSSRKNKLQYGGYKNFYTHCTLSPPAYFFHYFRRAYI